MTRKILKRNGRVVYRSTVRSLTPDELADETMKQKRKEFTKKVNSVLGDGFKLEDFANEPELEHFGIPIYPNYANEDNGESPQVIDADDEPDPDPDTYDHIYTKSYIFIHNLFSRLGHLMLLAKRGG
jgi:hypothetical protein